MKAAQVVSFVALTLLPWPAVWGGLYYLKSAVGTFALYHGLCLLPAIVAGRSLWIGQLRKPTSTEWFGFFLGLIFIPSLAVLLCSMSGDIVVSKSFLMNSLHNRGYSDDMLLPISLYLIFVNGPLEEFFWRGIILNLQSKLRKKYQPAWELWTAVSFAAWHYLVLNMLLNPGWALPMTVLFTFVGFFLGWIMRRCRSIVLVSLWHGLVFDGAVIAVFFSVLSRAS